MQKVETNPFHQLMKVISEVSELTRKSVVRFQSLAARENIKALFFIFV